MSSSRIIASLPADLGLSPERGLPKDSAELGRSCQENLNRASFKSDALKHFKTYGSNSKDTILTAISGVNGFPESLIPSDSDTGSLEDTSSLPIPSEANALSSSCRAGCGITTKMQKTPIAPHQLVNYIISKYISSTLNLIPFQHSYSVNFRIVRIELQVSFDNPDRFSSVHTIHHRRYQLPPLTNTKQKHVNINSI